MGRIIVAVLAAVLTSGAPLPVDLVLTVSSIELRSNTGASQYVHVEPSSAPITITLPFVLSNYAYVLREFGSCSGDGTVRTCTGDGDVELKYPPSPLSGGADDNEVLVVTATSGGFSASGTVTIRRTADLSVGPNSGFQATSTLTATLTVAILNQGPDTASSVRIEVDGIDSRASIGAPCQRSGSKAVCTLGSVPKIGGGVSFVIDRCAALNPVTVSVSATTTDTNPANNSGSVPALPGGGPTCDQLHASPPASGGPAAPVPDDGYHPIPNPSASPSASPAAATATDASVAATATPVTIGSAATTPGGNGAGAWIAVAVVPVLAAAGAGVWRWRRRRHADT